MISETWIRKPLTLSLSPSLYCRLGLSPKGSACLRSDPGKQTCWCRTPCASPHMPTPLGTVPHRSSSSCSAASPSLFRSPHSSSDVRIALRFRNEVVGLSAVADFSVTTADLLLVNFESVSVVHIELAYIVSILSNRDLHVVHSRPYTTY